MKAMQHICVLLGLLVFVSINDVRSQPKPWFTVYYPTWMQIPLGTGGYGLPPWEVDWTRITHVVHFANGNVQQVAPYFSYVVNNQTGINDSIDLFFTGIANPGCGPPCWTAWQESLRVVTSRYGIKLLLTVSAVDAVNLNYVANDSIRSEVFAQAAIAFLGRHGYDGLEVDWETWITPITSTPNVNRLMRILHRQLSTMNPRGLLFLSPSTSFSSLYYVSQDTCIDMYNLQMYDFGAAWYPAVGSNASWYIAPLTRGTVPTGFEGQAYDSRGPLQWIADGHDSSRMGVLMPTLGVVYRNVDQLFQNYSYNMAVDLNAARVYDLRNVGGVYGWDAVRHVPFVAGTATSAVPWPITLSAGQRFFGSFENGQSIGDKIIWLMSIGIGGVGMYDLKGDSDPSQPFGQRNPLHAVVRDALLGIAPPPPPTPTTAKDFKIEQNYPNPFNPMTTIIYSVTKQLFIKVKVYNVVGQEVATLYSGLRDPGTYTVDFTSLGLASGTYYVSIQSGKSRETKKMVLMK